MGEISTNLMQSQQSDDNPQKAHSTKLSGLSSPESKLHKTDARLLTFRDAIPTPRRLDLLSPSNAQHQKNFRTLACIPRPRSTSPRGHLMGDQAVLGKFREDVAF
jgi:hypothetical protein